MCSQLKSAVLSVNLRHRETVSLGSIIRTYYEQLYTNKLDNLEEMNNVLETYSL